MKKKLFLILALIIFLAFGCSKNQPVNWIKIVTVPKDYAGFFQIYASPLTDDLILMDFFQNKALIYFSMKNEFENPHTLRIPIETIPSRVCINNGFTWIIGVDGKLYKYNLEKDTYVLIENNIVNNASDCLININGTIAFWDNHSLVTLENDQRTQLKLPSTEEIGDVYLDEKNNIFVIFSSGEFFQLNNGTTKWNKIGQIESEFPIIDILVVNDEIWANSLSAVYRWESTSRKFETILNLEQQELIANLITDNSGIIFVVTSKQVYLLFGDNFKTIPLPEGVNPRYAAMVNGTGHLFIVSELGIFYLDTATISLP